MEKHRSKTTLVLGILVILLVGYITFGAYSNYQNSKLTAAYQQGFVDAQTVLNQNIINSLNQQGFVAFTAPTSGNETITLKLGIIPEEQAPAQ